MLFWVRWIRLADTAAVRGGKPCAGAAAKWRGEREITML
jgi:hypothetical protein